MSGVTCDFIQLHDFILSYDGEMQANQDERWIDEILCGVL